MQRLSLLQFSLSQLILYRCLLNQRRSHPLPSRRVHLSHHAVVPDADLGTVASLVVVEAVDSLVAMVVARSLVVVEGVDHSVVWEVAP